MRQLEPEYFGSPQQQGVQARAEALWTLVHDDPRFCTHGCAVGVASESDTSLQDQIALARLQGVGAMDGLTAESYATRAEVLAALGLKTDGYITWEVGAAGLDAAAALLARRHLPGDLTAVEAGPDTPPDLLAKLDRMTQGCDVLLPMGSFVRGLQRPSTFLMAVDGAGEVVGASASVAQFHPDHPRGRAVWWGMLATDPRRRGEGIALILGAMVMQAMHRKFGYEVFWTGIREGNAPSEALCRKLGLQPTPERVLIAIDPAALGAAHYTK